MRRFILPVALLAVGVILGLVLAPVVFDGATAGGSAGDGFGSGQVGTSSAANSASSAAAADSDSSPSADESGQAKAAQADDSDATDDSGTTDNSDATGDSDTANGSDADGERKNANEKPTKKPSKAERVDALTGVTSSRVPKRGGGTLVTVPGKSRAPDPKADRVITLRFEVEKGLPVDGKAFAKFVLDTLNDERSWGKGGKISFAKSDGKSDFRVVLASPDKVDELCAPLKTEGKYSCGRYQRATLNAKRYVSATAEFLKAGTMLQYRHYVINHEVGHLLGHQHQQCPGKGEKAPVMQQQTITLDGCKPNGWPTRAELGS